MASTSSAFMVQNPHGLNGSAKHNGLSESTTSNGLSHPASNGLSHTSPTAQYAAPPKLPDSEARSGREDVDRILGDLSEKLADVTSTPPITNAGPGAIISPKKILPEAHDGRLEPPIYMLFGTGPHAVCGTIYDKSLRRLGSGVLGKLLAKGHMNGTICIMDNYTQSESMLRLQNYLDTGTYKPFGPVERIECLDTENNIKLWQPGKEPRLDAIRLAESTLQLFLRELDLYKFAAEIEYESLLRRSSAHIIQDYPKNLKAILALLNMIYPVAIKLKDNRLVYHIEQLVEANCKSLAKVPQFTELMNLYLSAKNRLGRVMLDGYITAANDSIKKLSELTKREAALATRKDAAHPPPDKPAKAMKVEPFSPPRSPLVRTGSQLAGFRPEYLPMLAEAIKDNSLVIAKEAGYGTLIKKGAVAGSRNRDFTFGAGEMLILASDEFASNSYNNCMVYNSMGQKGDILRTLVREVAQNLGVAGKFDVVFAPPPYAGRVLPLDREGRLSRLERGDRARSRSPMGMYRQ